MVKLQRTSAFYGIRVCQRDNGRIVVTFDHTPASSNKLDRRKLVHITAVYKQGDADWRQHTLAAVSLLLYKHHRGSVNQVLICIIFYDLPEIVTQACFRETRMLHVFDECQQVTKVSGLLWQRATSGVIFALLPPRAGCLSQMIGETSGLDVLLFLLLRAIYEQEVNNRTYPERCKRKGASKQRKRNQKFTT